MAAPRPQRLTRSTASGGGANGLDDNFCGRSLRNRTVSFPPPVQPVPPSVPTPPVPVFAPPAPAPPAPGEDEASQASRTTQAAAAGPPAPAPPPTRCKPESGVAPAATGPGPAAGAGGGAAGGRDGSCWTPGTRKRTPSSKDTELSPSSAAVVAVAAAAAVPPPVPKRAKRCSRSETIEPTSGDRKKEVLPITPGVCSGGKNAGTTENSIQDCANDDDDDDDDEGSCGGNKCEAQDNLLVRLDNGGLDAVEKASATPIASADNAETTNGCDSDARGAVLVTGELVSELSELANGGASICAEPTPHLAPPCAASPPVGLCVEEAHKAGTSATTAHQPHGVKAPAPDHVGVVTEGCPSSPDRQQQQQCKTPGVTVVASPATTAAPPVAPKTPLRTSPRKGKGRQAGQAAAAADSVAGASPGPTEMPQKAEAVSEATCAMVAQAEACEKASKVQPAPEVEEPEEEQEEEEEDPDVYYFESDHVALKHNKDYQRLLQTIVVLEAQRAQAIRDVDSMTAQQRAALADPITFVQQIQNKEPLGLPTPQRVVQLPPLAWDHYTSGVAAFPMEEASGKRHCTRRLKLSFDKGYPIRPASPLDVSKRKASIEGPREAEGESQGVPKLFPPLAEAASSSAALPPNSNNNSGGSSGSNNVNNICSNNSNSGSNSGSECSLGGDGLTPGSSHMGLVVRGRLCEGQKPETFNQLWTVEEQKRLEELLVQHPPEEVEARRWQKIATALGNRTPKQVASRVQKYFIKLAKAGLPVPGRTPNLFMYTKKQQGPSRRHHPLNRHLLRPSTFMSSHHPPVYMEEEEDEEGDEGCMHGLVGGRMGAAVDDDSSDEEGIPPALRLTPEYQELVQLKRLRRQRLEAMQAQSAYVQHHGYKCDACGAEPIQGVRWRCSECPADRTIDFCDSCADCLYETDSHKAAHRLEPVYRAECGLLDRDYCMAESGSYNYLDPNYYPANR